MFCTACEIQVEDISHYKTEIHEINTKRKIKGLEPYKIEDFEELKDGDSHDLSSFYADSSMEDSYSVDTDILIKEVLYKNYHKESKCLFCDQIESVEHYISDHNLDYDQVCYIYSKVCFICYEGFVNKKCLKLHLESNNHRKVYSDGLSLFLDNGKVLKPDRIKYTILSFNNLGFKRY